MAYEGTVSAGIDFDKLKVKVNPDKKEIRITVPEAKILDCSVNEGSLKYIFEKDEYILQQFLLMRTKSAKKI